MTQLDRLSALDAAFLHFEHADAPMHVAGLYIFSGTPDIPGRPGVAGLFGTVEERLPEVPRYRQRVVEVPFGVGQPVWVEDPDFDLSYHLRRLALPQPGGEQELLEVVSRIHARPLDRRRPLWEMYIIEGLSGDRVALYSKVHHAMIDGISGIDLATILLDLDPDGRRPNQPDEWDPEPLPSGSRLVADVAAASASRVARGLLSAVRNPLSFPRAVLGTVGGASRIGSLLHLLRPAPRGPLNVPVGAARRIALVSIPLARAKAVKNALGGTVNDVVLTTVGEAIDIFLEHRGVPHEEEEYRVMVPVSVRDPTERHALGNRVTAVFVDLPVGPMPARRRLAAVTEAMRDLKERRHAVAADQLIELAGWAPATLHDLAGRLQFRAQRFINTVVSNVPGVQFPLYAGGARLIEAYPLLPLTANLALITCVTSYDGVLHYGLIGDYDALPDLDVLADGIRRGFDRLEMAALAKARGPRSVPDLAEQPPVLIPARRRAGAGRSVTARPARAQPATAPTPASKIGRGADSVPRNGHVSAAHPAANNGAGKNGAALSRSRTARPASGAPEAELTGRATPPARRGAKRRRGGSPRT